MDGDLYRKQYDFELEQRNSIVSATNVPIIAITVVAGACSAILVDYQYKNSLQSFVFSISAGLTLLAIALSAFYLFRSFWNYEYQKLPNAAALKQYYGELLAWHGASGCKSEDVEVNTKRDFSEYVDSRLAEASDWNGQNNIVRGNYLHMATAAIAIGAAFLVPTGSIYVYNKVTSDEKIHQVKVVNSTNQAFQEVQMSNQSTSTPAAPSSPAQAPVPAAKPSGPPNVAFKSHTDLAKPNSNSQPKK